MERTDYQHAEDFKAAASTSHTQAVARHIKRLEQENAGLQKRVDELLTDNTRLELARREATAGFENARHTLGMVEYDLSQWRRMVEDARNMGKDAHFDEAGTKDNNIVSLMFRAGITVDRLRKELAAERTPYSPALVDRIFTIAEGLAVRSGFDPDHAIVKELKERLKVIQKETGRANGFFPTKPP